jgi:hypothetical protein
MNTYDSSPAAAACAATAFARLPVEAQAIVSKPSSRARARATETTLSLKEWVGFAASFLIHSSRRPSCCASRSTRASRYQTRLEAECATSPRVGPARAGSRRSATASAARPGSVAAARPDHRLRAARRPLRAARSTARRRSARQARRSSCIPCNEETLAAYVKKPPPGSVVGGRETAFSTSPRPCSWSLMELAPFPFGRLPGFRRAISLHPSGCVLLCGPNYKHTFRQVPPVLELNALALRPAITPP